MSTYELMQMIIQAKNKEEIIKLLDENRVSVEDSKYC